jgi:hypothetical protein
MELHLWDGLCEVALVYCVSSAYWIYADVLYQLWGGIGLCVVMKLGRGAVNFDGLLPMA